MAYYDNLSDLPVEDQLAKVKEMRDEAWYANVEWLEAAEVAHKMKAGDQWTDNEKFKLELQGREALVWNYIHPAIELTIGVLTQNPVRIYPFPVEVNDDFLCDILEDIITYIDTNQIDAEEEHKTMFENCIITGIGDVVVDVDPNPENPEEIVIYERALDAYERLIDPMSKQAGEKDARYSMYERWVTAEDFKVRYPDHVKDMEEIFTEGATGLGDSIERSSSATSNQEYASNSMYEYYDSQNKRILVTHFEYKEAYKRYYYITAGQDPKEFLKEDKKTYKKLSGEIVEIYDTKIIWIHYIHSKILWRGETPVYKKEFSSCRMKAYTDKSKRMHTQYGIVKPMIGPQRECNKRWMHSLKLLGKQGVGLMAEISAFHNLDQATDSWADPDAITFMAKGGLKKIQEKSVPTFPDAPMRMEEMNKQAMREISGINPDLMGQAQQRREPGINLRMRQQQGLTMLSKLFANYKRTLKEVYMRKAEIIVRFMPDTQIRKILGESEKYSFQQGYIIDKKRGLIAPIRKIRDLGYNIRIEDAPGGLNKTMGELAVFMDMMEKGFPVNPNTIIDKLDLSPAEKADWKAFVSQQQEFKQQTQQVQSQTGAAKVQLEGKKHSDNVQIKAKELQDKQAEVQMDNDTKLMISAQSNEQRDIASQRDFTAKVMEMDAEEKKDLIEILKYVREQSQTKLLTNAKPASSSNERA